MTKVNNLLVLSPKYTSGKIFNKYEVDAKSLDEFEKTTPDWILERRNGIGLFIPGIMKLPQQLMNILSVDHIPQPLKEAGAASYFKRESLGLSIPENNIAKKYLYYTALHEVLDLQNSKKSMYISEQKVIQLAKKNHEDIRAFLWSHLSFFRGSLAVQGNSTEEHAMQIQEVIDLLEKEIMQVD